MFIRNKLLLFQGRQNDIYKEFRTARNDKKFIVSPHWLLQVRHNMNKKLAQNANLRYSVVVYSIFTLIIHTVYAAHFRLSV